LRVETTIWLSWRTSYCFGKNIDADGFHFTGPGPNAQD
jgi:hypothetical protein